MKQAVRGFVGHLCGNALNQMPSLTLNRLVSIIRCTCCGVVVPPKATSLRVDMCGLTGEQDPDSDLGGVDGPWHAGEIFGTMGRRKHVSCADDPGF